MSLTAERLGEIAYELVTRPSHDKVRTLIYSLLVDGLGAKSSEVLFELPLQEVHGRADALLGRTVFEFKTDLRRERKEAEEQLTRYLTQRERETGEHYIGIATDGAEFVPFKLRDGELESLEPYSTSADEPRDLLAWLGTAVAVRADLTPDPETVARELGRASLAYGVAKRRLADLWEAVQGKPEVEIKRREWSRLLERVYGGAIEDDELFFQHTYLTIVAKTMAVRVVGAEIPEPADLLAGRPFRDTAIDGAVESDFFDWVLVAGGAGDLVQRIARQVARFRLDHIEHDVLKALYESLIDPQQRHDLGEYYTPDWLAKRMCDKVIDNPLEQRVLDPACGSGTFLFHAIRRFLSAAGRAKRSNAESIEACCRQIIGVDVHPMAVIIARVTYLLALGEERLTKSGRPPISIPVYLGDSLQWNTAGFLAERDVLIEVPDGPLLHFPFAVASQPDKFDAVIQTMLDLSEEGAEPAALRAWLLRQKGAELATKDMDALAETYSGLRKLREDGRNHIWGYVARNLSRPVWLSSDEQKADVVIGNPPWLAYRHMSSETQKRFRKECEDRGIWAGGKVATHQDLSAYFFARCVELYLRLDGTIAFLMPYAALNRRQFEKFRKGWFGNFSQTYATVHFTEAWAFDETVQPLFPVPSCLLIAKQHAKGPLPKQVFAASGTLPKRDASLKEAEEALKWKRVPWPAAPELGGGSPYRDRFRQGATMVPRMLCVVERQESGRLGVNPAAPLVASRRTSQEKPPWKALKTLRGNVEAEFLRTLYLGESIAPYRLLEPATGIVPWHEREGTLLNGDGAERAGYLHLSRWLKGAERLWGNNSRGTMTLTGRWDYHGELSAQFPVAPIRLVYAKAGTLPAAAILEDQECLVDHTLYWAALDAGEAHYLASILNSEAARSRVAHLQARGQWGARHFDKLMLELPIPAFKKGDGLHKHLAQAGERAEQVAGAVVLPEAAHFTRARRIIREALQEDGIAKEIERLVERLLR